MAPRLHPAVFCFLLSLSHQLSNVFSLFRCLYINFWMFYLITDTSRFRLKNLLEYSHLYCEPVNVNFIFHRHPYFTHAVSLRKYTEIIRKFARKARYGDTRFVLVFLCLHGLIMFFAQYYMNTFYHEVLSQISCDFIILTGRSTE